MLSLIHRILAHALAAGLLLGAACGRRPSEPVDPQVAADQAQRYQEMIARAEKKAREGQPVEKIQAAIQEFQQSYGRVPTNLTELVSTKMLSELPKPPAGRTYLYAYEKGRVLLVQAPDRPAGPQPAKGGQPYIP